MEDTKPYKARLEARMQELDAEVDKLKAQAKMASADQKARYNEYLDALDEKRESMKNKLAGLKDDSEDAFDEIKAGMKDAWQRLAIAKKAAEAQFKS